MAITSVTQSRAGDAVRVFATSDIATPIFYWYFDGSYVGETQSGERFFVLSPGEQARIMVLDNAIANFDPIADAPDMYPARVTVEFIRSPDPDIDHYLIYEVKNTVHTLVAKIMRNGEQWAYRYITPRLTDLATYQWRVDTVDRAGNVQSYTITKGRTCVRWPDAPNWTASMPSTDIIVEAA